MTNLQQAAEAYAEQQYPESEYPHSSFRKNLIDDLAGDLMTFATSPAAKEYWEEQGWVRVEDRLPEDELPEVGEWVDFCFEWETILKGKRLYDGYVALFSDGEKSIGGRELTHWRPLPSPPKPLQP